MTCGVSFEQSAELQDVHTSAKRHQNMTVIGTI
jgi:hypothetical protein